MHPFQKPFSFYTAPVSFISALLILASAAPSAHAQALVSSSLHADAAPSEARAAWGVARPNSFGEVSTRPFSALAVRAKVGSEGIGADLATPLNARLDLRAGFALFSTGANPTISDIDLVAHVHLSALFVGVDYYPFKGSFRISPGLTLHTSNHVEGNGFIPGGTDITFGNGDYYSNPADPLHAQASLTLGQRVGPRLTIGWGNMIPHGEHQHFSFPFEIGAQYVGSPNVVLDFTGSACDNQGNCGQVNSDPGFQQDIALEKASLQSDIRGLRFTPIVSIGVSYKF